MMVFDKKPFISKNINGKLSGILKQPFSNVLPLM